MMVVGDALLPVLPRRTRKSESYVIFSRMRGGLRICFFFFFPVRVPGVSRMCDQSCLTLCDPMDCRPPGSSVHEIFQARILE